LVGHSIGGKNDRQMNLIKQRILLYGFGRTRAAGTIKVDISGPLFKNENNLIL
jgi:hypothetical protein